jgi:hypothetical protein
MISFLGIFLRTKLGDTIEISAEDSTVINLFLHNNQKAFLMIYVAIAYCRFGFSFCGLRAQGSRSTRARWIRYSFTPRLY